MTPNFMNPNSLFRRHLLAGLTVLALVLPVHGQISFEKTLHDFGSITEGEVAKHVFRFKNVGSKPVKIQTVQASCGCTTPTWTSEPVAPNQYGTVEVGYNSQGRPGEFSKTLTVRHDHADMPIVLTVKGNVQPKAPADSVNFPFRQGNLGLAQNTVLLKTVKSSETTRTPVRVKNLGKVPLRFNIEPHSRPYLALQPDVLELKPGQETNLNVVWNGPEAVKAKLENRYTFNEVLRFATTESGAGEKQLVVTGAYERIYSPQELAQMPRLKFDHTEFDGGKVLAGQRLEHSYTFTNTGGDTLEITDAKASCGCTVPKLDKKRYAPGEKGQITAVFDSRGRVGIQKKTITVISNDPEFGVQTLFLNTDVQPDPFGANPLGNPATPGGF